MADSWKVEQTCVTGPSPVMDSSAPCANYEARKEWAEKECHMVSIDLCANLMTVYYSFRLSIDPRRIPSYHVLKNSMKPSYDHSILNVSMMLASMFGKRRLVSWSNEIFYSSCDTGGDCECLCSSLSAFAEKCQSIDVPVKWRTPDKCRK